MKKWNNVFIFCIVAIVSLSCTTASFIYTTEHNQLSALAIVRRDSNLCADEQKFLQLRKLCVKNSLENLLNITLQDSQIPHIAVCCSGGGYRAMFSTLGSIQGFRLPTQKDSRSADIFLESMNLGLLSVCTYVAALSGSTWAIAGLIQSQQSIDARIKQLCSSHVDIFDAIRVEEIVLVLLEKHVQEQPISLIDIYGELLAQKLLPTNDEKNQNKITFAEQQLLVQQGHLPLPVYTAITGNEGLPYSWIEFTPFEIGCVDTHCYIPAQAFGYRFKEGKAHRLAPAQSLGYMFGIWGSALSANIKEFFDDMVKPLIGEAVQDIYTAFHIFYKKQYIKNFLEHRISPAQVPNWMYALQTVNSLSHHHSLTLVDAGIDFNLPTPPLLREKRTSDIIIILDASSPNDFSELKKAEEYARCHGYKFPPIDYTILNQPCSVHKNNEDIMVPIVIYMPLMKNHGYDNGWDPHTAAFTSTFNFSYTPKQIAKLIGLSRYNMTSNMPLITHTIKEWIIKHSS